MAPADFYSPAELNARPDRDWNPWICNNRLLMAATDAGGAHEVSWATNNAEARGRLGMCTACNTPIFTRVNVDAPLVPGSFRSPFYFTSCPARLAINNYIAAVSKKRKAEVTETNTTATRRRLEAQSVQQHHESLLSALKGKDVSTLRAQGKFALDLREITVLCQKELNTLTIHTDNEINSMPNLELRSKLVKFQEGVRVLKDMLATGTLVLDSKYHQLKTICSFPPGNKTFSKFSEVAIKASITEEIVEPNYTVPLNRFTNMDYVKFHNLEPKLQQKAVDKVFRTK